MFHGILGGPLPDPKPATWGDYSAAWSLKFIEVFQVMLIYHGKFGKKHIKQTQVKRLLTLIVP